MFLLTHSRETSKIISPKVNEVNTQRKEIGILKCTCFYPKSLSKEGTKEHM